MSPEELLAGIDTIVVLCMENRSFDHYLGALRLHEGRMVEGLTGNETNPDPNGVPVPIFKLNNYTPADPPHQWNDVHAQWNTGKNDGFVVVHAGSNQQEVMGYHVREQLPITYALADGGAVCDQWYCSLLAGTWPNRFYLHGATANGQKENFPIDDFVSIFELLDDAGVSNRNYYSDIPWCSGAYGKFGGVSGIENFFSAAQSGTLPQFSIIDPQFLGSGANDDHPDHDIQLGQALIGSIYAALAQSPQWDRCLFVVTYDEHGGFYDHVPPPTTYDERPEFAQLGFRVPSLVLGPFVKRGCVVNTVFEHVSVIKTLTLRYQLPVLNDRVAMTNDLSSCIDANYLENPQPPITLPRLDVSMSRVFARPASDTSHPEMRAMADSGKIPRHLDRRSQSNELTERWLRHCERLGIVRLRS